MKKLNVQEAARLYQTQPRQKRLFFGVGLLCFSLAGLYFSAKLEQHLPPPNRKDTLQEWKMELEEKAKKELN
jgi:type II secretory pathway component PulM